MQTVKDLTAQYTEEMRIMKMRMDYERLRAYGGSMQIGGTIPFTGLYKMHKGERVYPENVSVGGINITINASKDPRATADELVKALKYKLSTELRGLL